MSPSVIIAGAGPSGLMLAAELGLAGIDAVVLERRPTVPTWSQTLSLHMSSVEMLRHRGLDCFQGARRLPNYNFGFLGLTTMEDELLPLIVSQRKIEDMLEGRAAALGVRIRRGQEVVGVEQDADGVSVTVKPADGDEYQIRADYLVGCDGGRSVVRRAAGIGFPGTGSTLCAVTGDIELAGDDFQSGIGAGIYPGGLAAAIPHPDHPGILRATAIEFGAERPRDDVPVTVEEFHDRFLRVSGRDLKIAKIGWMTRFGDATRLADSYRAGRIFVSGDAAHIHFPSAGQGLNTGIQDAVNLGWKLAATIKGWVPQELLDTYHAERHPVGRQVCVYPQAQVALMHPLDKVGPLRELFSELIQFEDVSRYIIERSTGLGLRYRFEYPGRPFEQAHHLLGRRIMDAPLKTGAGETSIAATLHDGHGVLLDLSGGTAELPSGLDGWAGRVDVHHAEPAAGIDAAVVLIRPDGHIAYADSTGTDPEGVRTALTTWFGATG